VVLNVPPKAAQELVPVVVSKLLNPISKNLLPFIGQGLASCGRISYQTSIVIASGHLSTLTFEPPEQRSRLPLSPP
jgi:hypothetical protein